MYLKNTSLALSNWRGKFSPATQYMMDKIKAYRPNGKFGVDDFLADHPEIVGKCGSRSKAVTTFNERMRLYCNSLSEEHLFSAESGGNTTLYTRVKP